MMNSVQDYVARIDETCGAERHFIVIFKYDSKGEAMRKILTKAKTEKSISKIIFELTFGNVSFRLYRTGKAIFRDLRDQEELLKILSNLLL